MKLTWRGQRIRRSLRAFRWAGSRGERPANDISTINFRNKRLKDTLFFLIEKMFSLWTCEVEYVYQDSSEEGHRAFGLVPLEEEPKRPLEADDESEATQKQNLKEKLLH